MKCPYCEAEMKLGTILTAGGQAIYWFPYDGDREQISFRLSKARIERGGGFVLDDSTKIGLFAKQRPECYYCQNCHILLVSLNQWR